jgi:glycosyltransferase involved in cell wall biosynthesis
LKVLHVIPAVAPRYGGPSQVIFEMCRALVRQDADVLIATTDADGPGHLAVELDRPIAFQDTPTIFFKRQWSQRFAYSRPLARWLDRQVTSFDAVHIHAVFSHACIAAARACHRHRVPYIVRPLGSLDPWSMRQKPLRKKVMWHAAVNRLLRSAAALHYTATEERQLAESSLGLDNGVVIPLGIEMDNLQEQGSNGSFHQHHSMLDDHPYILTLSRLHPKKNIELLLDVFLSLAGQREYDDWRLVIAGDGEARYVDSLKLLVRQKGGDGKVLFTGWLGGAEKTSALRNATLLVLPSHQENFGIAAVEALSCGVPVVVSEHVNLAPEIKNHDAGWVTALDAKQLADTLVEALGDEVECSRRGQAGRAFVLQQFSWTDVAVQLLELYSSIARAKVRT